jgi:hypothetical protein
MAEVNITPGIGNIRVAFEKIETRKMPGYP